MGGEGARGVKGGGGVVGPVGLYIILPAGKTVPVQQTDQLLHFTGWPLKTIVQKNTCEKRWGVFPSARR